MYLSCNEWFNECGNNMLGRRQRTGKNNLKRLFNNGGTNKQCYGLNHWSDTISKLKTSGAECALNRVVKSEKWVDWIPEVDNGYRRRKIFSQGLHGLGYPRNCVIVLRLLLFFCIIYCLCCSNVLYMFDTKRYVLTVLYKNIIIILIFFKIIFITIN